MKQNLTIDRSDLFGDMAAVADSIGFPATLKLIDACGGEALYVPKRNAIIRSVRDQKIRAEFNGRNHSDLAQKYGLTVRHIRRLVTRKDEAA